MRLRFTKQVVKDIQKETPAIREKLALLLSELSKGVSLTYPTSKNMTGYKGLKELRLTDRHGIVRVFYILENQGNIYFLHLFRKKTQKTPQKEINLALKRYHYLQETEDE